MFVLPVIGRWALPPLRPIIAWVKLLLDGAPSELLVLGGCPAAIAFVPAAGGLDPAAGAIVLCRDAILRHALSLLVRRAGGCGGTTRVPHHAAEGVVFHP